MFFELSFALLALATSAIASVLGFGGGMLLIAIMPGFLPPTAIIPLHGITQLASNSSRMLFSLSDVQWSLLPKFLIGSLIGLLIFSSLLYSLPTDYIPIAIGSYILLSLWSQSFNRFIKRYENFYLVGALQTGLGLIVGATGPLATSILARHLEDKNKIIATGAILMTISHLSKILVFGLIGFKFFDYSGLIVAMCVGAIIGSYIAHVFVGD